MLLWIYSPYFLYRIIWLEYHTGDNFTYNKPSTVDISKYSEEYMEALFYYSPYLLWRLIWIEKETGLSRKEICNLRWTDDLSKLETHVRMFINLLPKRCEYILGNYKAKKIDYNLVYRRIKDFECAWQKVKISKASRCVK